MLIGYVRVSKSDGTQTLAPQRDAMLAAGVDPTRIYEDLASGRHDGRPGLTACLKAIQPGNTLVLWKLDRLGRDLRHLVNTVEDLRTRGVGLKVLTGAGAQIDTTTANGRLAFGIFAAFAEFERELIAERTMAGLAAARARGRMGGRPRKMDGDGGDGLPQGCRGGGGQTPEPHDHHPLHLRQRRRDAEGCRPGPARRHASFRAGRRGTFPAPVDFAALQCDRGRVMGGGVPAEALSALRRRLLAPAARHPERSTLMASTAQLYAVSRATLSYKPARDTRCGRANHIAPPRRVRWRDIWAEYEAGRLGLGAQ
jgi:DNA invertase Pin-like site-specific DNA recombinase